MKLQDWIDAKYLEISKQLPVLVNTEPTSFRCGHVSGYKACLLEIDRFLEDFVDAENERFS